jgi:hypothetical protein
LQPVKTQPGEVLQRLCNGLLHIAAWSAAAAVVTCTAASGQGAVFGQRTKRFVKGLEVARKKPKA